MVRNTFPTLCLLLSFFASSQNNDALTTVQYSHRIFETISLKEGLPSPVVFYIHQQDNGYLWFGTNRGAARFDGVNFDIYKYDPGHERHISSSIVQSIASDKYGYVWLGTEAGLTRIDPDGNIKIYQEGRGLPSPWIRHVIYDSSGRLWVATQHAVALYDYKHDSFSLVSSENIGTIKDIHEDEYKNIWFSSTTGVHLYNKDKTLIEQQHIFRSDTDVNDVVRIGDSLAIASTQGAYLWELNTPNITKIKLNTTDSKSNASSLTLIGDELWIGTTGNGITIHNIETDETEHITSDELDSYSLPSTIVHDVYEDAQKILWIATDSGIAKAQNHQSNNRLYRSLPNNRGLVDEGIYSLTYLNEGEIVISAKNNIDVVDIKENEVTQNVLKAFNVQLATDDLVWKLRRAGDYVWAGSSKGLRRYNIKTQQLEYWNNEPGNKDELKEGWVFTVTPDQNGGAWYSLYPSNGIHYFNPDKSEAKSLLYQDGSTFAQGLHFAYQKIISSTNHLWIASTNGAYRYNIDTGELHNFRLTNSADIIRVSSIKEDQSRNIWLATEGSGLIKLINPDTSEPTIKKYLKEDGLPSNTLVNIAIKGDNIWGTTEQDIFKLNMNTGVAQSFIRPLPVGNKYFSAIPAIIYDKYFVVGSEGGVFFVNTETMGQSNYAPSIAISSIHHDGVQRNIKPLLPQEKPKPIAFTASHIKFRFQALDFKRPKSILYRYKLQNHTDWSKPSSSTEANFYHLPPGRYTFIVESTNSDGAWTGNEQYQTFTIKRDYVTLLPWGLCMVMLALVIALVRRNNHS